MRILAQSLVEPNENPGIRVKCSQVLADVGILGRTASTHTLRWEGTLKAVVGNDTASIIVCCIVIKGFAYMTNVVFQHSTPPDPRT